MIRALLRLALPTLLALPALAAPLGAQLEERDREDDLSLTVRSAWPTGVVRGYAPLEIVVENHDETSGCFVDVELANSDSRGPSARVITALALGPGERAARELLVPCFGDNHGFWTAEARSTRAGRVDVRFRGFGARGQGAREHFVLVALPPGAPSADTAGWSEALKTADLDLRRDVGALTVAVPGDPEPNAHVASCAFDDLPARHEAYSSLDLVLLDTADGLPDETRLAPLLAWARQGGTLALHGEDALARAREHPALAPWTEERFALRVGADEDGDGGGGTPRSYALAHGRLLLTGGGELLADEDANAALRAGLRQPTSWVPSPWGSLAGLPDLSIPGLEELPFEALTLFLMAFAVLVGPVNFALLRKLGRLHLTLVTIPVLSLVACVFLLAFAFLSQGIDVKAAVETWTVLDQRAHRASTSEVRLFWAGLAPGPGLVPGPGTSCYADPDPVTGRRDYRPEYRIEEGEGRLFAGGYLPTRTATRQVVLTDRAARGRLAFERAGGAVTVHNGLGVDVGGLLVRDADGEYWRLAGELVPDGRVALARTGVDEAEAWLAALHGDAKVPVLGSAHRLPPATYAAALSTSPFRDACGVELAERVAHHRLVGIVATEELGGAARSGGEGPGGEGPGS